MALSATRNRIIRLNLGVTVATFALTVCIMPASWFGMNIAHGLSVRGPPRQLPMSVLLPMTLRSSPYRIFSF